MAKTSQPSASGAPALRIGLVGCGRISARHLQVINAIDELKLAAVCDLVKTKASQTAQEWAVPAYTDYREMIEREKPDLVALLTESGSHARLGIEIAPLVKSLIIEKPLALDLSDADRLIEVCDTHRTRLFVVKQNRFNRPVVRLRKAYEAGRFGKMVLGTARVRWCRDQSYYDQDGWRGTWRDDGGVLTNQASHHIDLLQWIMGPVECVKAYAATRLANIETEDTGIAIMRFASGALGVVEATTGTRPKDLEGSISILGEHGSVVIAGFAVNRVETWNFAPVLPEDLTVRDESVAPPNVYGWGHYEYYLDVLSCIRTGRRAMLDGIEGRKSLELINAIYESAATGEEVRVHFVPRCVKLGR